MPAARIFIDANVFLYARDASLDKRGAAAAEWLRLLTIADRGRSNLQVINEVTNVMLRKRQDLSPLQIFAEIDGLRPFGTTPIGEPTVDAARMIRVSTQYSWWDCLLLASALELGCTHFLSEDMQSGQTVSNGTQDLTIVDPFAHSPGQLLTP